MCAEAEPRELALSILKIRVGGRSPATQILHFGA